MQSENQIQILDLNFEILNRLTSLPARHFPASVKRQKVIDWRACLKQNMKLDLTSVLAYIKDIQYIYLLVEVCTVCSHSKLFSLSARQYSHFFLMLCLFFFVHPFLTLCLFVFSPFPHALTASYSLSVFEAASRCRTESLLLGFCSWPRIFHNSIYRVIF